MTMPRDLLLLRHGESEGNVATTAAKSGDLHFYTDSFMTTPGHQWRLTALGRAQAAAMGAWLTAEFPAQGAGDGDILQSPGAYEAGAGTAFDRMYCSPYVRTRETAGLLGLPGASWLLQRAMRERDWGDIGSLPRPVFEERYPDSAQMKKLDPLYWQPPGGESLAQVCDRVRDVLSTLHRECPGQLVLAVTHGEVIRAFQGVLERWDDGRFVLADADRAQRIGNCEALHYSRVDPVGGGLAPRLSWLRKITPVLVRGTLQVQAGPWEYFAVPALSNADLLCSVAEVPSLFT